MRSRGLHRATRGIINRIDPDKGPQQEQDIYRTSIDCICLPFFVLLSKAHLFNAHAANSAYGSGAGLQEGALHGATGPAKDSAEGDGRKPPMLLQVTGASHVDLHHHATIGHHVQPHHLCRDLLECDYGYSCRCHSGR